MKALRKMACSQAGILLLVLLPLACSSQNAGMPDPAVLKLDNASPSRVLFVGNSYLYYNDSLHNHVRRLAADLSPLDTKSYEYKSATIGGASLSHHNIDGLLEPGKLGLKRPFELVILQGGSGEPRTPERRKVFHEQVAEKAKKIRATGAEVALYMTHAYVKPHAAYDPNMIDVIARTYLQAGNENDALVIPVGLAFDRAYRARPDIELHKAFDGSHPSLLGTYLAACVVYQSVYGTSPTGTSYNYFDAIGTEDAEFLRRVADETVREFYGRDR